MNRAAVTEPSEAVVYCALPVYVMHGKSVLLVDEHIAEERKPRPNYVRSDATEASICQRLLLPSPEQPLAIPVSILQHFHRLR